MPKRFTVFSLEGVSDGLGDQNCRIRVYLKRSQRCWFGISFQSCVCCYTNEDADCRSALTLIAGAAAFLFENVGVRVKVRQDVGMFLLAKGHCGSWRFAQIFTAFHGFCKQFGFVLRTRMLSSMLKLKWIKQSNLVGFMWWWCFFFLVFNLHSIC